VLLNTVKVNARNLALIKELVAAVGGRTHFKRLELRELHKKLRGRAFAPYFITKNAQARPSIRDSKKYPRGTFIVDRFLAYAKKHPPEPMPEVKPKKEAAKPKKEMAVKKKGMVQAKGKSAPKTRKNAAA
jgi:hypothetical protein